MLDATTPITVLAVDDHPLIRSGILRLLSRTTGIQVIAEAANGAEALEMYRLHKPDITLMDIQMPDMCGVEAIAAICEESPEARIIVLTTFKADVQALRALRAGAQGFLLKNSLHGELIDTIQQVYSGRRRITPQIATALAQRSQEDELSGREEEILQLAADGSTNQSIAANLCLSVETVKVHMKNIFSKMSANDRTHAVTKAVQSGIFEL